MTLQNLDHNSRCTQCCSSQSDKKKCDIFFPNKSECDVNVYHNSFRDETAGSAIISVGVNNLYKA